MNKHQQRTESTKGKLLKSARRIFARDGFEASRIDDIARAAGYTRGAFYAHFQTKEDLFFALLEQQSETRVQRVREMLAKETGDRGRMEALRGHYLANLNDPYWPILLLEFKLYALRHPKLRAKLAESHRRIAKRMMFEKISLLLPSSLQLDPDRKEQIRYGLEALVCGLALQREYDSKSLAQSEAENLLGRWFETLLNCRPEEAATN